MICKEKCSFRQTVNGVLTASSSPTKHSTNAIQLSHRSAYLIPKTSRPDLNPATGKQVCYDYQRHERWRFASSCKYDHVCIKPQCLGTHPAMAAPVCHCSRPPILNAHSTAELPPNGIFTTELAGDVSTTLLNAGTDPVLRTPVPAECGER